MSDIMKINIRAIDCTHIAVLAPMVAETDGQPCVLVKVHKVRGCVETRTWTGKEEEITDINTRQECSI